MKFIKNNIWKNRYFEVYDKILLNSDIYLAVREFHLNSMESCSAVLDSGCGTGNVILELLKRGYIAYAVDNSEKALDILRKKCVGYNEKLYIHNADIKNLSFKDKIFDGAISMFVVHYIDDPEVYLKGIYRVLKPGGVLALTGRVSSENMERILKSYEESLRKRNLLPKIEREFSIFKEKFLAGVSKAVISGCTYEQMRNILMCIGFIDIEEYPNPYFGQCYSLVARK